MLNKQKKHPDIYLTHHKKSVFQHLLSNKFSDIWIRVRTTSKAIANQEKRSGGSVVENEAVGLSTNRVIPKTL